MKSQTAERQLVKVFTSDKHQRRDLTEHFSFHLFQHLFLPARDKSVSSRHLPGDPRRVDPDAVLLGGGRINLVPPSLGDQHLLNLVLPVAAGQPEGCHPFVVFGIDVSAPAK
jgi:hypothetical protein